MSNKMQNDNPVKTELARSATFALALLLSIGVIAWLLLRSEPAPVRTDCDTNSGLRTVVIKSEQANVRAEVAESGTDKARGLSGRNCLSPDTGMLFSYELAGDYCFWMKDMNFSIDMIWLNEEKRIITVKDSVAPDTYPQSFCPDKPASYIVEVPAGFASQASWGVNTQLSW